MTKDDVRRAIESDIRGAGTIPVWSLRNQMMQQAQAELTNVAFAITVHPGQIAKLFASPVG